MSYVEYSANNSGGHWWLTDDDWRALEKAGWKAVWENLSFMYDDSGEYIYDEDGLPKLTNAQSKSFVELDADGNHRYMGALAKYAFRKGLSLRDAAAEFDEVTSQCSTDAGCACCGQPHNFTEYSDDGKYVRSGPDASYVCEW